MSEKQFNPVVEFDSVDSWRGYIEANIAELTEAWRDETLGKLALPIGELLVAANFYAAAAEAHELAEAARIEAERVAREQEQAAREELRDALVNAPAAITATMKVVRKQTKALNALVDELEYADGKVVIDTESEGVKALHSALSDIRKAVSQLAKASGAVATRAKTGKRGNANAGLAANQGSLRYFTLLKTEIRVHTATTNAKNNGGQLVDSERNYGVLDLDTVDAQGDAAQGLVKHIAVMRERFPNARAENRKWREAKTDEAREAVADMEFLSIEQSVKAGKIADAEYAFEIDNETGLVVKVFTR